MATSSILGGERVPVQPAGTDVASLGPSDSTDSGSDTRGAFDEDELASDTDAEGTGERGALDGRGVRSDADILPDHVEAAWQGAEADLFDDEGLPADGVEWEATADEDEEAGAEGAGAAADVRCLGGDAPPLGDAEPGAAAEADQAG